MASISGLKHTAILLLVDAGLIESSAFGKSGRKVGQTCRAKPKHWENEGAWIFEEERIDEGWGKIGRWQRRWEVIKKEREGENVVNWEIKRITSIGTEGPWGRTCKQDVPRNALRERGVLCPVGIVCEIPILLHHAPTRKGGGI